jgi:hypothetical protein
MLYRKTVVVVIVFLCILAAGGVANHHMSKQRSRNLASEPHPASFTIYSARYSMNAVDRTVPFTAREYVRIIHREKNGNEP